MFDGINEIAILVVSEIENGKLDFVLNKISYAKKDLNF